MAKTKASWRQKMATDNGLPRTMVIPAPREVDAVMKTAKRGRVLTINDIRQVLARQHQVDMCCPMTTGIFAWIAAHAAAEAQAEGEKRVTPWWRTVKTGGELNPKYPGGVKAQARLLRAEGRTIVKRGKRWFVEGVE